MPESTGDANLFPDLNHELLSSLFMSMTGARPLPPEGGPGEGQSTAARTRGRTNRNRIGVAHNVNLDSFLHDFVISVMGAGPGTPMFFMGNPGDYAWGHEGIDTIVTQLLNQMEGTGPPPLAREKIDEIPKGEICQEQVETKLQCSVCLEDFQLNETVRQLPCSVSFCSFLFLAKSIDFRLNYLFSFRSISIMKIVLYHGLSCTVPVPSAGKPYRRKLRILPEVV